MRILYLSQYFPPETGATQSRAYDMAHNWVKLGHKVTVIAEVPNHPSGIILPEFRGKLFHQTVFEGIKVIRVGVITSPVKSFYTRLLFYVSYMLNAILAGWLLARERYDFIYATSPPLFVGAAGLALRSLKKTPLVLEVRDLWPEIAIELGELHNRSAIRLATWLEETCYSDAAIVIVVTQATRKRLIQRGIPEHKMILIPNGADPELFRFDPVGRENLRQALGFGDKMVAIYAGLIGIAQGLETVLEAAKILNQNYPIHFVILGEGSRKKDLIRLAERYKLSNLVFINEQPREVIPTYLSAADVAIIPLRDIELFKSTIPSKLFDAWACQRPVILGVQGEARQILERAGGGIAIPPEKPGELANALVQLLSQPGMGERMGQNGRALTIQEYSRQVLATRLIDLLSARFFALT
jgi:glycosyltransferase involved in cell wall biosynthesis